MYYRVLVASQRFHGQDSLTYNHDGVLEPGQVVEVPLQRKNVLGIVESTCQKPTFTTKPIARIWDVKIPSASLQLLEWLRTYYPAPLGMLVELFTPPALPQKLTLEETVSKNTVKSKLPPLTSEQTTAVQAVLAQPSQSFLLHGDTGSGKTRVYIELTKKSLASGESVLILTPEIGLTEPLLQTFRQSFGSSVVVTHSGMTPATRRQIWLRIAAGKEPLVIIGPRSALFSPVKNLGLLVIDEFHDTAYKQEQAPYYQTTRVAARLASLHSASLVMGSATPPISDYFVFKEKQLPILRMAATAIEHKQTAQQQIVDQRDRTQFSRSPWLSTPLLLAIEQALENGEQSILFLNRRGSARLVLCENCGWQATCPHCDTPLTFHQDQHLMRCHSCDFSGSPPSVCPDCKHGDLLYKSIGTKALEAELRRLYPSAKISRFDRDTVVADRLNMQYDELRTGAVDIIVGTQAIAKGFDLPKLSVVGIVNADSGLQIPDFTASERSYQLISQVSGRIGRGHRASKLLVQTYQPDNPILRLALQKDYQAFYSQELLERQQFKFPPYYFLMKITCVRASGKSAQASCEKLVEQIRNQHPGVIVEGPTPRFVEKIAGKYAWHLIVKAKSRSALLKIASILPGNVFYDLDPSDLL